MLLVVLDTSSRDVLVEATTACGTVRARATWRTTGHIFATLVVNKSYRRYAVGRTCVAYVRQTLVNSPPPSPLDSSQPSSRRLQCAAEERVQSRDCVCDIKRSLKVLSNQGTRFCKT